MGDALVICGGGRVLAPLPDLDAPFVVAADGGAEEAHRLGYRIDVLIGDMDSVRASDLAEVTWSDGAVEKHPWNKDETDLELAMGRAVAHGAMRVVVAGGDAGRFDMILANALLLASPRWADVEVDAVFGGARLTVVRTRRALAGPPGSTVSLFALGGPAHGVRTEGLRWALDGETLEPGATRGLSNEFAEAEAAISVEDGVVMAVQP